MSQTSLIAVIEDDPDIRSLVCDILVREGFEVEACRGGEDFDRATARRRIDLLVLDLMLSGEDGLSICRRLRSDPASPPILMVTAKGADLDRIIGLEIGADDYLPKPFNPRELIARIRAVLRRTRDKPSAPAHSHAGLYRFAGWTLNSGSRVLNDPDGRPVELTGAEFELLMVLLGHPQRVLSRDQILDWTRGRNAAPFDRTIDVQLSRLRRKLRDDPRSPSIIRTVRGGGYMLTPTVELGRP